MTIGMTQSVQGMQNSLTQFNQVAAKIAQEPTSGTAPEEDTVDLSAQAVALIQAKNSFEANTKAFKADDQMTQYLFNALG